MLPPKNWFVSIHVHGPNRPNSKKILNSAQVGELIHCTKADHIVSVVVNAQAASAFDRY